ncbi:MAG: electron transport complex subunit RsxC [Tissierellia bacterium]|nr:electron transport complex subunit RsxC [Tissierellia bacterium]
MKMSNLTFKGGVHIPEYKEFSEGAAVTNAQIPSIVYIPMSQHVGAPCEPIVKKGDYVKVGQLIGHNEAGLSADIHSSVSGTVKEITERYSADGWKSMNIAIESDGLDEIDESIVPVPNYKDLSFDEIVEVAKRAGIVGMGGAGFPLHAKLRSAKNAEVDTVILNGAECEPFLTCDYRLMLEQAEGVSKACELIKDILNCNVGYIGVEDNKPLAIDELVKECESLNNVGVASLKTKFPQGDSTRILDSVTGRKVPVGGRTTDVSVFNTNVGTAYALYEALTKGVPLYQRIVTVSGPGVKTPKNLLTRVGTPISALIEECGGFVGNVTKVICGGPMTGNTVFDLDAPILKTTTGITVLTDDYLDDGEESPCIKCCKCLEVCPSYLNPSDLNAAVCKERFDIAKELNASECILCGSCSFICPAKRKLTESIKLAIREIKLRYK